MMAEYRIGDKVRLRSTGRIGHVVDLGLDIGPYVQFDSDDPNQVPEYHVITDLCDEWEMLEPIQRHAAAPGISDYAPIKGSAVAASLAYGPKKVGDSY